MDKKDNIEQLASKLLTGKISEKELETLNAWYATEGTNSALQSVEARETVKARMLQRLQAEINTSVAPAMQPIKTDTKRKSLAIYYLPLITKYAAAIAILAALGLWLYTNNSNTPTPQHPNTVAKRTQSDQRSQFLLPDGTKVWLNASSTLTYEASFPLNKGGQGVVSTARKVTLTGEAFFDVAQDKKKPFILHTANLTTTVLGTSFNARALPSTPTEITVTTGKVKVEHNETRSSSNLQIDKSSNYKIVTPNQQIIYNPTTKALTQHTVDTTPYTVWKEKKITFNETPLATAALMLGRYYNVIIIIKDEKLKEATIIGEHEGKSLESVLKAMQHVIGFDYEFIDSKHIEITNAKP